MKHNLFLDEKHMIRRADKIKYIFLFLLVFQMHLCYAQQESQLPANVSLINKTVKGNIADSKGEGIIGASIILKSNTTNGTISDINGNFTINVPDNNAVLVISYIGYVTQEVSVSGKTDIRITLSEDQQQLDEVVVVGYGTQKKASLTGSVATVGEETFQDRGTVSNPLSAMQGQIPGMIVTKGSSAVGREDWSFKIRGEASVNSTSPLVLIDGTPGNINDINPDDIENISVLKDASAAIYGARAAGGVVLVTTKRGKTGKITVNYKGNIAVKTPEAQTKFMNQQDWAYCFEEGVYNDGFALDPGGAYKVFSYDMVQAKKLGKNSPLYNSATDYSMGGTDMGYFDYDLNDYLWKNATSHSHSISMSGGSERNVFNLSVGYMSDGSMLEPYSEDSKRYNIRFNNDYIFSDKLKVGTSFSFNRREADYATYNAVQEFSLPAGSPLETKSGQLYGWGGNRSGYGLAKRGGNTETGSNNFHVMIQPRYKIMKELEFVANVSLSTTDLREQVNQNKIQWYTYNDEPIATNLNPSTNQVSKAHTGILKQDYQAYLDYKKTFRNVHALGVMAGLSYEREKTEYFFVNGDKLSVDNIHSLNMAGSLSANDKNREWALASYFARLNYGLKDRYLIEFLGRSDGSSRFSKGNRWANFWGASAAWRISEESWMKATGIFDNLKLRVSYGQTGNQSGIEEYDSYAIINQSSASGLAANYPLFGTEYGSYVTYGSAISPDRTWERISTMNFGIDFAVLNNRLSGQFDIYKRKNNDMLVSVTYPQVFGTTSPLSNSGELEVKGWEASLTWRDKINDFSYWVSANISDSKNKLISMDNAEVKTYGGVTKYLVGNSLNTYWGHKSYKLIESEQELINYRQKQTLVAESKLKVGDMMYHDTDGDGKVTKEDLVLLGDQSSRVAFSLNMGANWKNLDLNVIFQGVGKANVIRDISPITVLGHSWYAASANHLWEKQWTTVGEMVTDGRSTMPVNRDPNAVPRVSWDQRNYNYLYSDAWYRLQNAAYCRLKNLVVGYTLPKSMTKKINLERVRIYFSGNDLFEWTKLKDGYDPENLNTTSKSTNLGTNTNAEAYSAYPLARTYSFGIDITF